MKFGVITNNLNSQKRLVEFESFDREIPASPYKASTKQGECILAVGVVHGGPEGQERLQYAYAGLY